jgi:hypothetical protein
MTKSKSNGYKLARRFINSKDIFKLLKRLTNFGYGYTIKDTPQDCPYHSTGYKQFIDLKYVSNDNKTILPIFIYFKDRQEKDNFKQDIQISYYF